MRWPVGSIKPLAPNGAALEKLRRQIHLGELISGERLPPERQLADELGVARATLREALRALESEGWIVTRPGKSGGAFVVGLAALQQLALLRLRRDIALVYRASEFLQVALPVAARYAAERRSSVLLYQLEMCITRLEATLPADAEYKERTQLLVLVVNASANPWLVASAVDALASVYLPMFDDRSTELDATANLNRRALLNAMRAREVVKAESAMRRLANLELAHLAQLTLP